LSFLIWFIWGEQTLDDYDFIDVDLYSDKRNLKNVYKKDNFKYTHENEYILYKLNDEDLLNYRHFKAKSNLDLYNIENNSILKDEVNGVKRMKYLDIVKNNPNIVNEKNI
jgi:hypothetical protein